MRALIQRVTEATVTVESTVVGTIGPGLLVLIAAGQGDAEPEARWLAHKVANLRIFPDDEGKMNCSVKETGGSVLVVSQFTLYGDIRRGFRPSFTDAALPAVAEPLVNTFVAGLREEGISVQTGVFRAHMRVSLINDGPVTIWLEKEPHTRD